MKKEMYLAPDCAEMIFEWTAALCQSGGTEDFGTDEDLVYPIDFWK